MDLKQKLSELGISPEFLTDELTQSDAADWLTKYQAWRKKLEDFHAEHILRPYMNKMIHDLLPDLPLGSSIGNVQKRSFEYELIGGM